MPSTSNREIADQISFERGRTDICIQSARQRCCSNWLFRHAQSTLCIGEVDCSRPITSEDRYHSMTGEVALSGRARGNNEHAVE